MKKRLLAILVAASATACTLAFSACSDKGHTHMYVNEIAEEEYLKSEATCTEKAVYYCSCACGERGEETFEYGDVKGHTFDKKVAENKYLVNAATFNSKAVYYYSCVCGETGTETFEYGNVLPPTEGLEYEPDKNGNYYTVKGIGTATDTEIIIASEYEGKPVIAIAERAFEDNLNITSIAIPDSIERIGSLAFRGCGHLIEINIPASVEVIGDSAFEWCYSVHSITVDEDNSKYKSENNCLLTKNGETLKWGCVTSIIPDTVKTIGIGAFEGCQALKEITVPDSVTAIAYRAFFNCSGLNSIVIPNSVETVGGYAFAYCTALQTAVLSEKLTKISDNAFFECENLTSIIIPDGVTSIGDDCFANGGLISVTIPVSVTSIGRDAFKWCVELTDINYKGTIEQWDEISKAENWAQYTDDYTVTCTDGKLDKYGKVIQN